MISTALLLAVLKEVCRIAQDDDLVDEAIDHTKRFLRNNITRSAYGIAQLLVATGMPLHPARLEAHPSKQELNLTGMVLLSALDNLVDDFGGQHAAPNTLIAARGAVSKLMHSSTLETHERTSIDPDVSFDMALLAALLAADQVSLKASNDTSPSIEGLKPSNVAAPGPVSFSSSYVSTKSAAMIGAAAGMIISNASVISSVQYGSSAPLFAAALAFLSASMLAAFVAGLLAVWLIYVDRSPTRSDVRLNVTKLMLFWIASVCNGIALAFLGNGKVATP